MKNKALGGLETTTEQLLSLVVEDNLAKDRIMSRLINNYRSFGRRRIKNLYGYLWSNKAYSCIDYARRTGGGLDSFQKAYFTKVLLVGAMTEKLLREELFGGD